MPTQDDVIACLSETCPSSLTCAAALLQFEQKGMASEVGPFTQVWLRKKAECGEPIEHGDMPEWARKTLALLGRNVAVVA